MTRPMLRSLTLMLAVSPFLPLHTVHAQGNSPDSVTLGALQADAVRRDPRGRQEALITSQSELRQRSISARRLPTLGASATGQYQSEVVALPFTLPGGPAFSPPPHQIYDAHVEARESLFDPTLGGRRDVERAQLAQSRAQLRTSLYALRQDVNDAYFSALQMQLQAAELATTVTDLEAQLRVVAERVKHGVALPGDSAIVAAELLRSRQSLDELTANRDAALEVLADLTGHKVSGATSLALPQLEHEVATARAASGLTRGRPEREQFASSRELLAQEQAAARARDLPRVSAFGRAGYGRPGLNPLARDFGSYWVAGMMVEWTPWNWGTTGRDREVLALQQQIVATEEAAFNERIARGVVRDLATIDRLERASGEDSTIVALREQVLHETELRFAEGVVTSAEYVDRQTDVLAARLARASHRVELAQARAHFLTAIGAAVR